MNRIQFEEIYTDTEKIKKRKQYHFILTRFAPVAACLIVGLLIWQPWGNSFINMGGDMAMPAAQMADSDLFAMSSAPAPEAFGLDAPPGDMAIMEDSDIGEPIPAGGSVWDDELDSDGVFRAFTPQDIEHIQEHINNAYAEITITGELPVLLERYMPQAFGPWFEWDIVFEIPSTEVSALLDELGSREEFAITRNEQNSGNLYAMVFFSYGE
jgi:hypothetical protein